MPKRRRHGRPIAIALAAAVATAAVVTAGWVARRGDGQAAVPSPADPGAAVVQADGEFSGAPSTTDGEAAPATVTTATRGPGPPFTPVPASTSTSSPAPTPAPEGFSGSVAPIDDATAARMTSSWRPGCPVGLSALRLVRITHWGFDGQARRGEIVVHRDQADRILGVFTALFAARFPMEQVRLVDEFGGDDDRSMAANNTSGFNCRFVAGTRRWSQHAYGRAVDVNPVQNPYVRGGGDVRPPEGRSSVRRDPAIPGLITPDSPAVAAFARAGWPWGGRWRAPDYQHFSSTGG